MSTLKELFQDQAMIVSKLLESDGVLDSDLESMMNVTALAIPEKADGYKLIMDRLESESEYWDKKAKEFAEAAKVLDNARERMKDHLKFLMQANGVKELAGNDFKFSLTNTKKSVVISNQDLVPKEYMTVKTTEAPDKARILADLEMGVPVAGAHAVEGFALKSSVNKSNQKKLKGA